MSYLVAQTAELAANDSTGGLIGSGILVGAALLLVIGQVVLFIAALVSVLRSPLTGAMKLVWVVVAFIAPFLGPVLWFVIGRRDARNRAVTS